MAGSGFCPVQDPVSSPGITVILSFYSEEVLTLGEFPHRVPWFHTKCSVLKITLFTMLETLCLMFCVYVEDGVFAELKAYTVLTGSNLEPALNLLWL